MQYAPYYLPQGSGPQAHPSPSSANGTPQQGHQPFLHHIGPPTPTFTFTDNGAAGPPLFLPTQSNNVPVHHGQGNNPAQPGIPYVNNPYQGYSSAPQPPLSVSGAPPIYHHQQHQASASSASLPNHTHPHMPYSVIHITPHQSQDQQLFAPQPDLLLHQQPHRPQPQHHHLMPRHPQAPYANPGGVYDHMNAMVATPFELITNSATNLNRAATDATSVHSLAIRSQANSSIAPGGVLAPTAPMNGGEVEGVHMDDGFRNVLNNSYNRAQTNTAVFGNSINSSVGIAEGDGGIPSSLRKKKEKAKKVPSTAVDMSMINKFKTKLCGNMEANGTCPYRGRCMFAHGAKELRTAEENLRENLVSEAAIEKFKADIRARKAARDVSRGSNLIRYDPSCDQAPSAIPPVAHSGPSIAHHIISGQPQGAIGAMPPLHTYHGIFNQPHQQQLQQPPHHISNQGPQHQQPFQQLPPYYHQPLASDANTTILHNEFNDMPS